MPRKDFTWPTNKTMASLYVKVHCLCGPSVVRASTYMSPVCRHFMSCNLVSFMLKGCTLTDRLLISFLTNKMLYSCLY